MEIKDYNIITENNTNTDVMLHDYISENSKSNNRNLKIGILGTVLLCSSPNLHAINLKYHLNEDLHTQSIECAQQSSFLLDKCIEDVNNIDKANYTKKQIIREILSFKTLVNSWDGHNALPLEIESASNAILFLNSIDEKLVGKLNDFYPNTQGTISFEWINSLKEKLFLEIGNDSFSFFVRFNNSEPLFFTDLNINNENINLLSKYIKSI